MTSNSAIESSRNRLLSVIDDIKGIKIQGATNVALEGVRAFRDYLEALALSNTDLSSSWNDILSLARTLATIRATEPALRNCLRLVLSSVEQHGVNRAIEVSNRLMDQLAKSKEVIARIGAEKIEDQSVVMTHCRSSVVEAILAEASNQGKSFRVVCTETRPRYQGRKTAENLLKYGIPVTMVVDSAMRWAMRKFNVDLILIGADAITVEGAAINKIGSRLLGLSAAEEYVPLYVASSLFKYDPTTTIGKVTQIEMRSPEEVWNDPPDGLKIENPAFEPVDRRHIDAYITEKGIIPPSLVAPSFQQLLPEMSMLEAEQLQKYGF